MTKMTHFWLLTLALLMPSVSTENAIFFPRFASPELPSPPCTAYDNSQGACKLLARCANHFAEIAKLSRSPCSITPEQEGVCCPLVKRPTADPGVVVAKGPTVTPQVPVTFPDIPTESINEACQQSIQTNQNKKALQEKLALNNIVAPEDSATYWHARLFETTNDIFQKSEDAKIVLDASTNLKQNFALDKNQAENGLPQFDVTNTIISATCPPDPICPDPKYSFRTMDGSCNNLLHKDWGKTGIAFTRMIPAEYEDGVKEIRLNVDKKPLPSARVVSTMVSPSRSDVYVNYTILIWQWGQFLDHDITHTPISKGANKDVDISCCSRGQIRPADQLDPECFPIEIPENDHFYQKFTHKCMDFVRSMPAIRPQCKFGPREQMNQITSFIDGSNVYGSTLEDSNKLRSFRNGKLKVTQDGNRELLPGNDNASACRSRNNQKCFLAGDSRVNEQVDLVVMHTLFVRQHNKIVEELAKLNPSWTDEILFQEGRRIVGAQMQHITYYEYLPVVLGTHFMETYGLLPLENGYFHGYRNDVDATITNSFATAAFRYGHTLITDQLKGFNKFGDLNTDMELSRSQFIPFSLYDPDTLDSLIRGLSLQKSQRFDRFFSTQLTNKLFAQHREFGMDLVALNIQRGRDHGLPPYVKWREVCNMRPVSSFQDLADTMNPEVIAQLQSVYTSVEDIDVFIGGVAENTIPETLVGPTFLCILGRQFIKLKIGDRFFYENGNDRDPTLSSFTEGQLQEIRKTTLSRIMCDNSDNVEMMQPLAFITAHLANKRALCASDRIIPKMSLEPWKNRNIWV